MVQKINFTMPLYAQPVVIVTAKRVNYNYSQYSKSKREAKTLQKKKSHAQGYAGARGPESQWAIISAVEHSLSAQSLIRAKGEGGTAHPPQPFLCQKFVFGSGIDNSFHLLKAARSIFPYLNNNERE